jgi:hypothetical protein
MRITFIPVDPQTAFHEMEEADKANEQYLVAEITERGRIYFYYMVDGQCKIQEHYLGAETWDFDQGEDCIPPDVMLNNCNFFQVDF